MSSAPETSTPAVNPARDSAAAMYRDAAATLAGYGIDGRTLRAEFERARNAYEAAKGSSLAYAELGALAYTVRDAMIARHEAGKVDVPAHLADTTPADGATVSPVAVARIDKATAILAALGVSSGAAGSTSAGAGKIDGTQIAAGHFARGTRVVEAGQQEHRNQRTALEAQPTAAQWADDTIGVWSAETWRDVSVAVGAVGVTGAADLVVPGEGAMPLTRSACGQLLGRLGVTNGNSYLWDSVPADRRADALRFHLATEAARPKVRRGRPSKSGSASGATHAEDILVLKTAVGMGAEGVRSAEGVVTDRYTSCPTPDVLRAVVAALGADATEVHVEGNYSLGRGRLTALWMADTTVDLACEDVFKQGIWVEWNDVGGGSIKIGGAFWRNLCLNLQRIDHATFELASLAHFGSFDDLVAAIKAGVQSALDAVAPVMALYGIARATPLPAPEVVEGEPTPTAIVSCLTEWLDSGSLGLPRKGAEERDRSLAALLAAVAREDSALGRPEGFADHDHADAINAVTRTAHEAEWLDFDARAEIEKLATRLLVAA